MEIAGILILASIVLFAIAASRPFTRAHRALLAFLGALGRRPWAAALTCAAFSVTFAVAYALIVRWPEPRGHDEFSYVLGADTFRHGRLANPTHPMWRFFETFHVLQHPTYASKYPPAQSLSLAAGWIVFGHPIAGVFLSGALLAAATWWMLRGFLSPRWALAGGLLAAAQFGAANEWMHNYWGGSLAAAGGVLVIGALPRLWRRERLRDSLAFAAGLVVLGNSRPFEGFAVAVPCVAVFLGIVVRRLREKNGVAVVRLVAPATVLLTIAFAWMGFYNKTVAGNALRLPYLEHDSQYLVAPNVLWLPLQPLPEYRHEEMRSYWAEAMVRPYVRLRTWPGFLRSVAERAESYWRFYLGPVLTVAFAGVVLVLRRRWVRFALVSLAIFIVALFSETYSLHHYASPATGLIVLLTAMGLQAIDRVRVLRFPIGAALASAVLAITLLKPALTIALTEHVGPTQRSKVIDTLTADGHKQLVVVRYGPERSIHNSWITNAADIDAAPIVWARDLGPEEDRLLLDAFRDRKPWLLEVGFGAGPPRLTPFPR